MEANKQFDLLQSQFNISKKNHEKPLQESSHRDTILKMLFKK